ncbi:MAG: V-type ATP synthase subunit F [Stomatobaculum sp.]
MYKVAVMGDWDSVYGFGALGLETVNENGENPEKAAERLEQLGAQGFAVVYITEALAARIPETIEKMRVKPMPAVILIPGISGNTGEGIRAVKRSVEQAVGSDIIFGGQQA